jgi:magnesium-transporting ATPase (P-type)
VFGSLVQACWYQASVSVVAEQTIGQLLASVPLNYASTCRRLTLSGYRVLALAYRDVPDGVDVVNMLREDAERSLMFAGFLVVSTPMKLDSVDVIQVPCVCFPNVQGRSTPVVRCAASE